MEKNLHILFWVMILCCCGCSSDPIPIPEEKPKIELTTEELVLSQKGETITFSFISTEAWTIDVTEGGAVSWCNITPTSGNKGTHTLTIKAIDNDTYDKRSAKVIIKAGTTAKYFVVTQRQKDAIIVAKNEYTVEAAGGDLKFEVNVNVDFQVKTSVDWIKQNVKSRGLEAKPLSFTITENTTDVLREGVITISYGELKQEIKVIQKVSSNKGTGAELEPGGGIEEG